MIDLKKALINYMSNEIKIKNLELDKDVINNDCGISSIEISETSSKTNKVNDPVGKLICDKEKKILEINNKILKLKMQQKKIQNILEILNIEEKRIIVYRYMELGGLVTWQDIATRMNMSYGTVKAIYNRAFNKMQQVAS